jgi:hypothetical protein
MSERHGPPRVQGSLLQFGIGAPLQPPQQPAQAPPPPLPPPPPPLPVPPPAPDDDDSQPEPLWRSEATHQHTMEASAHARARPRTGKKLTGMIVETAKKIDYKRAVKMVERGQLWEEPPDFIHRHAILPSEMKESWKSFFRLRVYHWILSAMVPDFKPKCACCGHVLVHNGVSKPPRLIFGRHENYLLNAPERFYCRCCLHHHLLARPIRRARSIFHIFYPNRNTYITCS